MSSELLTYQKAVCTSKKAFQNGIHAIGAITMVLGTLIIVLSTIWFSNLEDKGSTVLGAFAVSLVASTVQVKMTLILLFCGLQKNLKAFAITCGIALLGSSTVLAASLQHTVNQKALLHMSYGHRLLEEEEAAAVIITAGLNILFNSVLIVAYIINTVFACITVTVEKPYSLMTP